MKFPSGLIINNRSGSARRIHIRHIPLVVAALTIIVLTGGWSVQYVVFLKQRQEMTNRIADSEREVRRYRVQLSEIIETEKNTRLLAGLPAIHPDVRLGGLGGALKPDLTSPTARRLEDVYEDMEILQSQVALSDSSYASIQNKIRITRDVWRCIPARIPVSGTISSRYGIRNDPFTGFPRMHKGIDIAAPPNMPVVAAADGTVSSRGVSIYYGLYVEIDHGNGYKTRYAHLSSITAGKNMPVDRGDVIGRVGMTGRANGYHVHYEVLINDKHTNPIIYISPEGVLADRQYN